MRKTRLVTPDQKNKILELVKKGIPSETIIKQINASRDETKKAVAEIKESLGIKKISTRITLGDKIRKLFWEDKKVGEVARLLNAKIKYVEIIFAQERKKIRNRINPVKICGECGNKTRQPCKFCAEREKRRERAQKIRQGLLKPFDVTLEEKSEPFIGFEFRKKELKAFNKVCSVYLDSELKPMSESA